MNRISILDCTLRDGGYVNDFAFGENIIKNIIGKLTKASIDIVECGFLESGAENVDYSLYGSIETVSRMIGVRNKNILYVAMIQYGAISNEEIITRSDETIDGIRITFHEHEIEPAFILGRQLMNKGYIVFMQPVGTTSYTDFALLSLINRVNQLKPYGFYIVDTLGTMYKNDILRMFYLVDHNLDKLINVGFHSHNNLQLSFANAQELMCLNTTRNLIIDSSIFGMGRGAGNLNTELIAQYINSYIELRYDIIPILEVLDEYIKPLTLQYKWGYDAAYFISSVAKCHPNYASFLINKQTLHVKDINVILSNLAEDKRSLYDKQYIADEYVRYMSRYFDDSETIERIKGVISEKEVFLLAPGESLKNNTVDILSYAKTHNCIIISVNFVPHDLPIDVLFVSNMKRFSNIENAIKSGDGRHITIVTSNISAESEKQIYKINYSSYLNEENCIVDNAGLMCINLMNRIGVKKIVVAGFDGFSRDIKKNFYDSSLIMDVESERLCMMNEATSRKLRQLRTQMEILSLTKSVYR